MKRLLVLFAVLVLAGCASVQRTSFPPPDEPISSEPPRPTPQERRPEAQPQRPPSEPTPARTPQSLPPRSADQASSPAVMSLLGRADTLARNGNMEMAAATLERALDLEPRNAFIYQRLASVRLAEGQAGQAEAMARKSNSVAGDNPFIKTTNWQLIAEARRSAGNTDGAREAITRARDYRATAQRMTQ